MANVFGFNNVKMKDSEFCVDMFNTIINDQKELVIKTMFAYEKLRKENPDKFNGKDFLLKDYAENIKKLDAEFKKFILALEKYEGVRFRVKKERPTSDLKMEVDSKLKGDVTYNVEALKKMMQDTFTDNKINFRKLASSCQDPNYKNFEKAILKNTEIITTWMKQNVIAKVSNVSR